MTDCVLCDWKFSWSDPPRACYLPGRINPLGWMPDGPRTVPVEITPECVVAVAVAAHWADAHPEQLTLALGEPWQWGNGII